MNDEKKEPITQSEIDAQKEGRESGNMGGISTIFDTDAEKDSRAKGVIEKNNKDIEREEDKKEKEEDD